MSHEDLVTFEQAIDLNELGFDWKCNHWQHIEETNVNMSYDYQNHNGLSPKAVSIPTLEQAAKWLRDKKHILISIRPNDFVNDSGNVAIHYITDIWGTSKGYLQLLHSEAGYENYEFALEDAINEALELLKKE